MPTPEERDRASDGVPDQPSSVKPTLRARRRSSEIFQRKKPGSGNAGDFLSPSDARSDRSASQMTYATDRKHFESGQRSQHGSSWKKPFQNMNLKALGKTKARGGLGKVDRRFLIDLPSQAQGKAKRTESSLGDAERNELYAEIHIDDIVDTDSSRVTTFVSQELVGHMIESWPFRIVILVLIVVNAALIGVQTSQSTADENVELFAIFDKIVLTVFVCELLLKWYNDFFGYWRVGWNWMDFIIVAMLLLGPSLTFLGSSRVLRILRVVRAFRSLRSVTALTGLQVVVKAIIQSIPDMMNIVSLLLIILVVLGIGGVTLFSDEVPKYFGNLHVTLFSLFVCVTQDGWMDILEAFKSTGQAYYIFGAFFLIIAILIGAFIFANLIVAVVVTNLEFVMQEIKHEQKMREDTLGASAAQADDAEEEKDVPIISGADIISREADFAKQTPCQAPSLKNIDFKHFETFTIILVALEENLQEYTSIRNDLNQIISVVNTLNYDIEDECIERDSPSNRKDTDKLYDPDEPTIVIADHVIKQKDFKKLLKRVRDTYAKGDIMSNLMGLGDLLDEIGIDTTRNPTSISQIGHAIAKVMAQVDTSETRESHVVTPEGRRHLSTFSSYPST